MESFSALVAHIAPLGRAVVALSGGVDSALVAAAAHEALGDDALAVTVDTDVFASGEVDAARAVARTLGLEHEIVQRPWLDHEALTRNDPRRCYHCRSDMYGTLTRHAGAVGARAVLDGANADDANDYRPGMKAARELGVVSPLRELGYDKAAVRALATELDLPVADRPSSPCLATRIPYGTTITREALVRVDRAETSLRELGLRRFRVREHEKGRVARVEVGPEEIEAAFQRRDELAAALRGLGYLWVSLDLEGYQTGSMNRGLMP